MLTKGSICLKTYKDEVQKNNNFSKTKKKNSQSSWSQENWKDYLELEKKAHQLKITLYDTFIHHYSLLLLI